MSPLKQQGVKPMINMLVFFVGLVYGVWLLVNLPGVLFTVGANDTGWELLGALAYYLTPLSASLLAFCRCRKVAAGSFGGAAALWSFGVWDQELYLHNKFGNSLNPRAFWIGLLPTAGILLLFALYYGTTEMLGWPRLRELTVSKG